MRVHVNWGGFFPCEPDWRWDTATTPLPDFDLWAVFGGRGVMEVPDASGGEVRGEVPDVSGGRGEVPDASGGEVRGEVPDVSGGGEVPDVSGGGGVPGGGAGEVPDVSGGGGGEVPSGGAGGEVPDVSGGGSRVRCEAPDTSVAGRRGSGGSIHLAPGDCLLLRPRERYVCRTDTEDPLLVHVIHFDFVDGRGRPVMPDPVPALYYPLLDQTFFRHLTTRAIRAHLDSRSAEADDWLRATLHELARVERERASQSQLDARARRIQRICDDIARAPDRTWVVSELARRCFVSPDHFTRLFRELRGTTPREFIQRQRIDAAKRLLLSSSHSVGRIAELTGFSDIYHFSRQFKASTGRSPSQFRKIG